MQTLVYDDQTDRWQAFGDGGRCYVIRCGYGIEISIEGRLLPARVEYDTAWYVILENMRFYLHPSQRYKVRF